MDFEKYRDSIAALVPFYDEEGGNATRIYTVSGEITEDKRTLRWTLKRLARVFAIDLEALRSNYGKYLSLSQGVPLPFSEKLVLVPLKLRRIIGENDGAGGYVNLCAVEKVEECPDVKAGRSIVYLRGNRAVSCVFTRKTVERRFRAGELARERLLYKMSVPEIISDSFYAADAVKENCANEIPPELLMAMGKLLLKSINQK